MCERVDKEQWRKQASKQASGATGVARSMTYGTGWQEASIPASEALGPMVGAPLKPPSFKEMRYFGMFLGLYNTRSLRRRVS